MVGISAGHIAFLEFGLRRPGYFHRYKAMITDIERAVQMLRQGKLVAFPTETVYGLGADASNRQAIKHLYEVKGRPCDHPSIVHLASIDQLSDWTSSVPPLAQKLAEHFWPGPMTLILPKADSVLPEVTGGQAYVGIRLPSHAIAQQLIKAFGGGIVAPSANRFGKISPTTAQHVIEDFGSQVELVLDGGPCRVGVESTIVDFSSGQVRVLRPGMLSRQMIADFLGISLELGSGTKAPGTLTKHYSPQAKSRLLTVEQIDELLQQRPQHLAVLSRRPQPTHTKVAGASKLTWINMPEQPDQYAQQVYSWLRYVDAMHPELIAVEQVPQTTVWEAVRDRLQRATATT